MSAWLLLALPAVMVFALIALNALTWSRGPRGAPAATRAWSILIPARDEALVLDESLAAARRTSARAIFICDDHSTDATPEIIARHAAEDPRVRLVDARPLPPGWVGKVNACHTLAEAALDESEWLLFVDADVRLSPDAVDRLEAEAARQDAEIVTAVPRQDTVGLVEKLIVPLLHLTYLSWLWLPLVRKVKDPRVVAANGQVLAARAESYRALGGFAAVKGAIVDDVAFCRLAKSRGHSVAFIDGFALARCRMYRSGREVLEGFSKNLYAGIGATPLRLVLVLALYAAVYLLPGALLVAALFVPALVVPALVGVGANLASRALLAARWGHPWSMLALHPVSILGFFVVAANSARWYRKGALLWRGRTYKPELLT